MFNFINNQLNQFAISSIRLLFHTKNILETLPQTLREIKNSPNLRFVLANSFLINGIQFVVPFASYHFITKLLMTQLKNSYPDYDKNELVNLTIVALDYTVYMILSGRVRIKNIVFDSTAAIGATRILHEEFTDDERHFLCQNCKKESNHLYKEISLLIHYLIGSVVIFVTKFMINYIPYLGAPSSYLLGGYWNGFNIFQYPLTRENICAQHKIVIFSQDRTRLISFGIIFDTIEFALFYLATLTSCGFVSDSVLKASISNLVNCFSLIHAHQMNISIPDNQELENKIPLDPVTFAWSISILGTNAGSKLIMYLLNKNQKNELNYLEKIKQYWNIIAAIPVFYILGSLLRDLLIVSELQSLKEFTRSAAMRPYMIPFLEDAEELLKRANEVNDHPVTQLAYFTLKIPYINKYLLSVGSNYAKEQIGIDPVFTKALVKLIQLIHISENLPEVRKKITEVHKKSLESHEKQNHSWYKLFGFGSNPPRSWFIRDDFIKVKTGKKPPENYACTTAKLLSGNLPASNTQANAKNKSSLSLHTEEKNIITITTSNKKPKKDSNDGIEQNINSPKFDSDDSYVVLSPSLTSKTIR